MSFAEHEIRMVIHTRNEHKLLKMTLECMEAEHREDEARLVEKLEHHRNFQQMQRMMVRRACPNTPDADIVLPQDHIRQLEDELAIVQEAGRQERTLIIAAIDKFRASPTMDMYPALIEIGENLKRIEVETERRLAAIRAAR